jgi:adenosylmethionine-8-amino-7-oxononanoate aminotransferase
LVEKPDMMCLSKSIDGTIWQLRLYTRVIWCFYDDDINKHYFTGILANPTGCAAAL